MLKKTRAEAKENAGYDSANTRRQLTAEFKKRCGGNAPYKWQLDVTEAILLGLDTIVMAGTGAGKTMPFVMPLFLDTTKKKKVIVISTLNALEEDQVSSEKIRLYAHF